MNDTEIRYLKHSEIDYSKWDECIKSASNSRIYASSWYLDRSAGCWDALMWGDYSYVMPVTFRKKLGIKYLYQPVFSQQLGIFPQPPENIFVLFIKELKEKFRYIDIQLNSQNIPSEESVSGNCSTRHNYILSLDSSYKMITGNYSKNTKRNLEKAYKNRLTYSLNISIEEYIRFTRDHLQAGLGTKDLKILKSIIAICRYKGIGDIPGVYTKDNNLCATVFFCRWNNRIIYLNAASSDEGKNLRGMFLLLDQFIKINAGEESLLDFEGSMIPGVSRFYKGFGALPEKYCHFKYNGLPPLVRWLKK